MGIKVSIVIPCRNEVKFIKETVDAIYACSLPIDVAIQVFVVDGKSDDGTLDVLKSLQQHYSTLHVIENTKQLTPFAFNLGIYQDLTADYIQIVGARHVLSSNYIEKSLSILQSNPEIWCVGGRIINEYLSQTSEYIATVMATKLGMGIGNFRTLSESGYTDTVTSPMYPMWVFEKIGFFDEELIRNQDDDFNFRVTKAGGKIWFENDISLRYYVRGNFKGLWRQFFQYGYWKVYVNKKHKAITTMRQLVPPAFVFYLFLLLLSSLFGKDIFVVCAIPFMLYVILSFFVSFRIACSRNSFLIIFSIFPTLHLSYGLGYLKGMVEFLVLNRKPSNKQKRLSR